MGMHMSFQRLPIPKNVHLGLCDPYIIAAAFVEGKDNISRPRKLSE